MPFTRLKLKKSRTTPLSIDVLVMSSNIRSKDQIFYLPLRKRPPTEGFREFICKYSQIATDELNAHLETVREAAWR